MSAPRSVRACSDERGFSLLEVLISMAVMLLVLGGTMQMLTTAMNAQKTAKDVLDMNAQLRAAMDLIQRDLLQAGQGLPIGHRIGVPNGTGTTPIVRPGPSPADASPCPGVTTFPVTSSLPAVSVGPSLGPPINGQCTDIVTILMADSMFEQVPVVAIAEDGTTATFRSTIDIADSPDVQGDNLRVGDLLMLTKGSNSVLMYVTEVPDENTDDNTVTFGTGTADRLGLNQFSDVPEDPEDPPFGTINRFRATSPVDNETPTDGPDADALDDAWSEATRIRMVTYFVDSKTDPAAPRLMRVVNGGTANTVAFGVQAFTLVYDIAGQIANRTNVRMDAADFAGTGACSPAACSENQIRKATVVLSMRSFDPQGSNRFQGNHTQNTLVTQVSLRSLAFVDRYQ